MPRPQRPSRSRRGAPVAEHVWLWLLDQEFDDGDGMEIFMLNRSGEQRELRELWAAVGADVVATYANSYPGRRPKNFWKLSVSEMRRRVGGKGMPESDLLARVPTFEYGIPSDWLLDDFIWTWNGGTPPAAYVPFDRDDPPRFESQAAYLKRLRLLLPGELRRLRATDFIPETIVAVTDSETPADIDDPKEAAVPVPRAAVSPNSRGNYDA